MNSPLNQNKPAELLVYEDCNGNSQNHWRKFLTCSDGLIVAGVGKTEIEADSDALGEMLSHEDFLRLPPKERVKQILAKHGPSQYPLAQDQGMLNRAFAEILGCI